jgi:HEPN domain-containing protein
MSRTQYAGVSTQKKASKHRLGDAQALFNAGRWRCAMYIAGYSVECLLKAKLMKMYNCRQLGQLEEVLQKRGLLAVNATIFTHQLYPLLRLAQGLERLRQNRTLWPSFNLVNRWVPAWRYSTNLSNRKNAENFLQAVEQILDWIEHNV